MEREVVVIVVMKVVTSNSFDSISNSNKKEKKKKLKTRRDPFKKFHRQIHEIIHIHHVLSKKKKGIYLNIIFSFSNFN